MPARLCLFGLIFSLVLTAPVSGQACDPIPGAETQQLLVEEYAVSANHQIEKKPTFGSLSALEQFFCEATGKTRLVGPLLPAFEQALLRMEFSVWENEAWTPVAAQQYAYDEAEYAVNLVFQDWNGESWLRSTQVVFNNDDQGRNIESVSQFWDDVSWRNSSRRVNRWNEDGELVEVVYEDWVNGGWLAHRRDLMSYENGLLVEEVGESYDAMEWKSSFRYTQEYDEQGRQVFSRSEYYNTDTSSWIANGQGMVVYGENYREASSQSWDRETQEWVTYNRSVTTFNDQGNPIDDTRAYFHPEEGWLFTNRLIFTHIDAGLEVERVVQVFDGTDWINDGLYTSTYDSQGNLIKSLYSKWQPEQNVWGRRSMRTFLYNEPSRSDALESHPLGSVDMYPHPAREYVHFIILLNEPTQLIVDVYDLLGRQVVQLRDGDMASGMQRINWEPGDLAPGVYMARIQAGQRVETKKLVLIK